MVGAGDGCQGQGAVPPADLACSPTQARWLPPAMSTGCPQPCPQGPSDGSALHPPLLIYTQHLAPPGVTEAAGKPRGKDTEQK